MSGTATIDSVGIHSGFPDEWSVSETTTTVTAANQGVAELRVEARRLVKILNPVSFLEKNWVFRTTKIRGAKPVSFDWSYGTDNFRVRQARARRCHLFWLSGIHLPGRD